MNFIHPLWCVCIIAAVACAEPAPSAIDQAVEVDEDVVLLGGLVRARLTPAPPNADPDRVLALLEPLEDLTPGELLTDAQQVDGGWAVVRRNHELWFHEAGQGRRLDTDVMMPISVRGTQVAYARGHAPTLEVVRVDVRRGGPEVLTEGYAPVWNPALGPDGSVVFVSGHDGGPGLYRVHSSRMPQQLSDEGAFPSSIEAPSFDGRVLRFRDESGAVHVLAVAPRIDVLEEGVLR